MASRHVSRQAAPSARQPLFSAPISFMPAQSLTSHHRSSHSTCAVNVRVQGILLLHTVRGRGYYLLNHRLSRGFNVLTDGVLGVRADLALCRYTRQARPALPEAIGAKVLATLADVARPIRKHAPGRPPWPALHQSKASFSAHVECCLPCIIPAARPQRSCACLTARSQWPYHGWFSGILALFASPVECGNSRWWLVAKVSLHLRRRAPPVQ